MKILVLQRCAVEHPGTFREFWNAKGHRWHAVELDIGQEIPPLEDFDLLVMGGPMDVWQEERFAWLSPEKRAIRRWIRTLDRPVLGICLGHQLMADALGGRVTPMPRPEVGIVPVALTPAGCQDAVLLGMLWHGEKHPSAAAARTDWPLRASAAAGFPDLPACDNNRASGSCRGTGFGRECPREQVSAA